MEVIVESYSHFVHTHILLSAFIQFFILGMAGECLGLYIAGKNPFRVMTGFQFFLKMAAWGVLGLIIKYAFTGFVGFASALGEEGMIAPFFRSGPGKAFFVSVSMNILFGPQMMAFHRVTDNLIMKTKGFAGLEKSFMTLLWFWIPAHTVTFLLPEDYRIGLAALWSVALGVIMGFFKRKEA